jgi:uncharacterized protein YkwD
MTKKQKTPTQVPSHVHLLTYRWRIGWFAVLFGGLVTIHLAYAVHDGQHAVLGYSSAISASGLLAGTNHVRHNAGETDLSPSPLLSQAAQAKATDMVQKGYWSHITPSGQKPWSFVQQTGYTYESMGENLAYGFSTSNEVIAAWMNSKAHKANLLGQYQEAGFGIADGQHYQGGHNVVVVAMYATPALHLSSAPTLTTAGIGGSGSSARVDGLSVVASGGATWAAYASLGLIGAAAMGIVVTHLEVLRLGWYRSKHILAIHPVLDAAIIVVLALAIVYGASGFIR